MVEDTLKDGVKFDSSGEVLDTYEQGTFDPTITANSGGSITLNSGYNTLSYTKIGRIVHISGQIRVSSVSSPVGNTNITNLPFTAQSTTEQGRLEQHVSTMMLVLEVVIIIEQSLFM